MVFTYTKIDIWGLSLHTISKCNLEYINWNRTFTFLWYMFMVFEYTRIDIWYFPLYTISKCNSEYINWNSEIARFSIWNWELLKLNSEIELNWNSKFLNWPLSSIYILIFIWAWSSSIAFFYTWVYMNAFIILGLTLDITLLARIR